MYILSDWYSVLKQYTKTESKTESKTVPKTTHKNSAETHKNSAKTHKNSAENRAQKQCQNAQKQCIPTTERRANEKPPFLQGNDITFPQRKGMIALRRRNGNCFKTPISTRTVIRPQGKRSLCFK